MKHNPSEKVFLDEPHPREARDPNSRVRVQTINSEPSLADQQFKDQSDINILVEKHGYGAVAQASQAAALGVFEDVSNITDYNESLNKVLEANTAFMTLPAQVRLRFQNNPGELLKFLQNSENYDEGVKLGLFHKKPETGSATNDKRDLNANDDKSSREWLMAKVEEIVSKKIGSTPAKPE